MRKPMTPRDRVQRVSWEPDYDDNAWFNTRASEPPTRETHPDAFYRMTAPAYPVFAAADTRKKPYRTLSRTKLRGRLSRAGLRGPELKRVLNLIKAGPGLAHLVNTSSARMALGWDVKHLADTIGEKLARKVLRFVLAIFIVRDEFWDLAKGHMPVFEKMFMQARSLRCELHEAVQDTTGVKLAEVAAR
ncbi:hypothetical protein AB4Y45_33460 [Paraburkholderia sp. EG287A]|uniref:hypothetical protein n=1 Tax=Paraburkholderia sp. EG287A TaxID=3237012 RepID=UPI0034D31CEA